MKIGQKHIIQCRCVLPQFKTVPGSSSHQFIVFSIVDDDSVLPKIVQCNNCGVLHKVTDLCKSEILHGRESSLSITTIDDIKASLHPDLGNLLERVQVDLPTWEQVKFCIDEEQWGTAVILTSDSIDGAKQGKVLRILGTSLFKVDVFMSDEVIAVAT